MLSQAPEGGREGGSCTCPEEYVKKGQNLCAIAKQAVSSPFFSPLKTGMSPVKMSSSLYIQRIF